MGGRKSMAVSAFGGKPSSLGARVLLLYHAQGVELLDVYLLCFFFFLPTMSFFFSGSLGIGHGVGDVQMKTS